MVRKHNIRKESIFSLPRATCQQNIFVLGVIIGTQTRLCPVFIRQNQIQTANTNDNLPFGGFASLSCKPPSPTATSKPGSAFSVHRDPCFSLMEPIQEEQDYTWREVKLPSLIPVVPEPELERETGERRRGRDILVAVDHGPNSKHAFDWALVHLCRLADTLHLVHAVANVNNQVVYEASQVMIEAMAVEAFQVAMVKSVARVVEGDAGKVICREADRIKPAAVVMGTRGRGLIKSVLQGSVSEYCFHNCKTAPIIIVPGKGFFWQKQAKNR